MGWSLPYLRPREICLWTVRKYSRIIVIAFLLLVCFLSLLSSIAYALRVASSGCFLACSVAKSLPLDTMTVALMRLSSLPRPPSLHADPSPAVRRRIRVSARAPYRIAASGPLSY